VYIFSLDSETHILKHWYKVFRTNVVGTPVVVVPSRTLRELGPREFQPPFPPSAETLLEFN